MIATHFFQFTYFFSFYQLYSLILRHFASLWCRMKERNKIIVCGAIWARKDITRFLIRPGCHRLICSFIVVIVKLYYLLKQKNINTLAKLIWFMNHYKPLWTIVYLFTWKQAKVQDNVKSNQLVWYRTVTRR